MDYAQTIRQQMVDGDIPASAVKSFDTILNTVRNENGEVSNEAVDIISANLLVAVTFEDLLAAISDPEQRAIARAMAKSATALLGTATSAYVRKFN